MISLWRLLDQYIAEPVLVEQVPRQLGARAGVSIVRDAVAFENTSHPKPGSEDKSCNDEQYQDESHEVIVSCLRKVLLLSGPHSLVRV